MTKTKHMSRREFLKASGTATVVALAGITPLAALASNKPAKSAVFQEAEETTIRRWIVAVVGR